MLTVDSLGVFREKFRTLFLYARAKKLNKTVHSLFHTSPVYFHGGNRLLFVLYVQFIFLYFCPWLNVQFVSLILKEILKKPVKHETDVQ